jgi:hypothetical protein
MVINILHIYDRKYLYGNVLFGVVWNICWLESFVIIILCTVDRVIRWKFIILCGCLHLRIRLCGDRISSSFVFIAGRLQGNTSSVDLVVRKIHCHHNFNFICLSIILFLS